MNPKGVHIDVVVFTSINIMKIKFIAYIYTYFNPNVDEKSELSTKIERENTYTQFFLYQRNSDIDVMTSPTSNQIAEGDGLF